MALTDEETACLLRDAIAGKEIAVQRVLLLYYPLIERIVRDGFNEELRANLEPGDVIQDALVDVYRGLSTCRETESRAIETWVRRVTENRLIDTVRHYRRAKRAAPMNQVYLERRPSDESLHSLWEQVFQDSNPADRPVRRQEAAQALRVCLAELNDEQREAIVAHYFESLETDEIAERMDRTPGAVRELLRRARQRLKDLLGEASAWLSSR